MCRFNSFIEYWLSETFLLLFVVVLSDSDVAVGFYKYLRVLGLLVSSGSIMYTWRRPLGVPMGHNVLV